MVVKTNISERIKTFAAATSQKAKDFFSRLSRRPTVQKTIEILKWNNLRPRLIRAKEITAAFTKEQPKTAAFIYVCLFCAFSINFLDKPFALSCLNDNKEGVFYTLAEINPSGWWFLILIALWLIYMAVAGLSLTTEVFEKNLQKAHAVLFILLTLSLSSLVTLIINILAGRYTPEFLDTMRLYGFSAFRFRVTETSFPSFSVQSLWAVIMASAYFLPKISRLMYALAGLITLSVVLTAECFISDAVMGAFIGIMMYHAARWIVSENRDNIPLISL